MHSNKPIKVLQLGSPAELYGAERWILALIKHLNPKKVTTIVGVIQDDPEQQAKLCIEAEKLGYKTIRITAPGKVNSTAIKKLREYLLKEEVDILHTHFYKTDIIGVFAVKGTKCKIISTPHGWSRNVDFKLQCYETLDRAIFPFLNAVVPLSEELYSPLKKIPFLTRKLHLIINGVDLSEITDSTVINEELSKKKKNGKFIIGYIGQLINRKGLDILLKALQTISDIDWELFIIGEGAQRAALEKLSRNLGLSNSVHFLGFRPDRLEFLRGFDLFVLPSRLEGIPRCLMEAMAAKIPVTASDIPGSNNLIAHEETGLLFEVDDHFDLAKKIKKIATSSTLTKKLVNNSFKLVNERYSANRMAMEYEKLFIHLVKK